MFKDLFGKRAKQAKWEATLVWFRLRYLEAAGPTRCLNLLSRAQACGRIALYYQPGEAIAELYLGIQEMHARLLQRMVADFGFSVKPKAPEVEIPAATKMTAVTHLPWQRAFKAHIVNEFAFVSGGESKRAVHLPQPPSQVPGRGAASWRLPDAPPPGLNSTASWNCSELPAHLIATEPDKSRWLVGKAVSGVPLHVVGPVNIYGRQEAVTDWLVQQVGQTIALDPTNLVVIDGAGDLVPRLKRKRAVTRLLGEQLVYLDIDGTSLTSGFNPLAALPGESQADMRQRWQYWFQGMQVHPQGIELLAKAQQDGVKDIPTLRKWLKQIERQGQHTAVSSLGLALNRLTASPTLREWLEWPTSRFDILPEGVLMLACKGKSWDRQQLLKAALLAALQVTGVRLVLHGFPWQSSTISLLKSPERLLISNGPLLAASAIILTECHVQNVTMLATKFLANDSWLRENLALLMPGEGILISQSNVLYTTWQVQNA